MRCDNWSLMYFSSLSHDTISTALFQGKMLSDGAHQSLSNASSLWGCRNDTIRSTLKWSKIIPIFCSHKWFIKGWRRRGWRKGKEQMKDGKGQTHSLHILSSLRAKGGGQPIIQLLTAVTAWYSSLSVPILAQFWSEFFWWTSFPIKQNQKGMWRWRHLILCSVDGKTLARPRVC